MAAVSVKIVSNPKFLPELMKVCNQVSGDIARGLHDEMKRKTAVPFPPASAPGQPPRKRTGGLNKAIFVKRMGVADWAVGVNKVTTKNDTGGQRELLGLWLELGTGDHRQPFPEGAKSVGGGIDSAQTGNGRSSMAPRPFIMNTLVQSGPSLARRAISGGGILGRVKSFLSGLFGG